MLKRYTVEFKRNLQLAGPIMLGLLGNKLVAFADNIMVGRIGEASLAAVSLGNSVVFIAMAIGIGFSMAITPLVAEADGENNPQKGRVVFQHGMLLCTLTGLFMFIGVLLAKPVLYYMGQPQQVIVLAIPYMEIVALALIPLMIFQGLKQFADGLSQTRHAMYAIFMANAINVILNFLLIYGIWIFPRLEIIGAAIGTLLSQMAMALFMFLILYRKEKFVSYLKRLRRKEIKKNIFKQIIHLGFPAALQMLFEGGVFTASILLAGTLGVNSQAANQIALNLSSMTFMVAVGLGVTATIRVGNQKGKKDYIEMRSVAFSIFLLVFIIAFCFAITFVVLRNFLPTLYVEVPAVLKIASQLLIVAGLFQLSDGIQVTMLGALKGLQDVKKPTLITFIAYWVIGFPISFVLGKETQYGAIGIWIGLLAGLTVSAVFLYLRFNALSKKLISNKKKHEVT